MLASLEARELEALEAQTKLESHQQQMQLVATTNEASHSTALTQRLEELEAELKQSREALATAQAKATEANTAFEAAQVQLAESTRELAAATEELTRLRTESTQLQTEAAELREEAAQLREQAVAAQEATDNTELLEEVESLKSMLSERNSEVENLRRQILEAADEVAAIGTLSEEQTAELEARSQELSKRESQLAKLEASLEQTRQSLLAQTPADGTQGTEDIEAQLEELRAELEQRNAEISQLREARPQETSMLDDVTRDRELDERTRVLDERTEKLTDRELDVKRSEDQLNEERERIRTARQELEQRRVALQSEMAQAQPETTPPAPAPAAPGEPSVEQTQHLEELRSELAGMFGMSAPATGAQPAASAGNSASPKANVGETTPLADGTSGGESGDIESPDYVAAYMEQLLARTRGGGEGTSQIIETITQSVPQERIAETKQVMAPLWSDGDEPVGGVVADLNAARPDADSKTKRKAIDAEAMRENMQSLREVANYSARSALADYAWKRTRGLLALRVSLVALAAVGSVACYVTATMGMHSMDWLTWVLGFITVIGAVEMGYEILRIKSLKPKPELTGGSFSKTPSAGPPTLVPKTTAAASEAPVPALAEPPAAPVEVAVGADTDA